MFDGFLELLNGGQPAILGECLDATFSQKKAAQLISFQLNSQRDLTGGKPVKKNTTPGSSEEEEEEEEKPPSETEAFLFTVTKEIDNSTPDFFLAFCERWATQNVTWDMARVTLRKAGGGKPGIEYLVYEFTNVYVRSWNLSNQDGDDLPEEEIEFAFDTCRINYYPQTTGAARASLKTGAWDFGNHQPM